MKGQDVGKVMVACITGLLMILVAAETIAFTDAERCKMAREDNQAARKVGWGTIINTDCLNKGRYRLTGEVPVVPHYDPPDPLRAVGQMRYLAPGTVIEIRGRLRHGGHPWYKIARGGYVNSIALINNVEQ